MMRQNIISEIGIRVKIVRRFPTAQTRWCLFRCICVCIVWLYIKMYVYIYIFTADSHLLHQFVHSFLHLCALVTVTCSVILIWLLLLFLLLLLLRVGFVQHKERHLRTIFELLFVTMITKFI